MFWGAGDGRSRDATGGVGWEDRNVLPLGAGMWGVSTGRRHLASW